MEKDPARLISTLDWMAGLLRLSDLSLFSPILLIFISSSSYDLVDENTIDNNYLKVRAAPLRHTIPCVGYVIEDLEFKERNLKVDSLKEIVDRNSKALKDLYRVKERVYHVLKQLRENESFTFPDGTLVKAEDILHDPLQSRKIVILGDTCDSSKIASIAKNADLLIHEATLAYFPE